MPKTDLADTVVEGTVGVEGKDARGKASQGNLEGKWAFVDKNVGTHLIRNAFGGADEKRLAKFLSIPPGLARRFRDDVTVTVVFFETEAEGQVKAKL